MNTLALASVHTFLDGIHHLDALTLLNSLPAGSVHCVVTSPPYYGLRDYSANGQLGLEDTPDQYVTRLVDIFEGVRRVLREDGTCWLNLGSSYCGKRIESDEMILRDDLTPEERRYVFEELAKHAG